MLREINTFDRLEFRNVKYGYEDQKHVLNDLNLKISKGDCIGLMGSSVQENIHVNLFGLLKPLKGE